MNNMLYSSTFVNSAGSRRRRRRRKYIKGLHQYDYRSNSYIPTMFKEIYKTKFDAQHYNTALTPSGVYRDDYHVQSKNCSNDPPFGGNESDYVNDSSKSVNDTQIIDEHSKISNKFSHNVSSGCPDVIDDTEDLKIKSHSTPLLEDKLKTIYEECASAVSSTLTYSGLSNTSPLCQTAGTRRRADAVNFKSFKAELTNTEQVITRSNSKSIFLPASTQNQLSPYKLRRSNRMENLLTRLVGSKSNLETNKFNFDPLSISKNSETSICEAQNTLLGSSNNHKTSAQKENNPQTGSIFGPHNSVVTTTDEKIPNCGRQNKKKQIKIHMKNLFCCIRPNRSATTVAHEVHGSNVESKIIPSPSKYDTNYKGEDYQKRQPTSGPKPGTKSIVFLKGRNDTFYTLENDHDNTKLSYSSEVVRDSEESDVFPAIPIRSSKSSISLMVDTKHTQSMLNLENDQVMSHVKYSESNLQYYHDRSESEQEEVIDENEFPCLFCYDSASAEEHSDYYQTNNQDNCQFSTDNVHIPVHKCSIENDLEPETHEENQQFDTFSDSSDIYYYTKVNELANSTMPQNSDPGDEKENVSSEKPKANTYVLDISFPDDQLLKYLGESKLSDVLTTMSKYVIDKSCKKKFKEVADKTVDFTPEQKEAHTSMSYGNVEVGVQTTHLQAKKSNKIAQGHESEDERTPTETPDICDTLNEIKQLRKQLLENRICSQRIVDVSQQTSMECLSQCKINQTRPLLVENSVQTNNTYKINSNIVKCELLECDLKSKSKEDSTVPNNITSSNSPSKQKLATDLVTPQSKSFDDKIVRWLWSPLDHKTYKFQSWPLDAVFSKVDRIEENCNKKPLKTSNICKKKHQMHSSVKTEKNLIGSEVSKKSNSVLRKIVSKNNCSLENQNLSKRSNKNSVCQTLKRECSYRVNLAHKKYFNSKAHHRKTLEIIPHSIRIKDIRKKKRQQSPNTCVSSQEDTSFVSGKELALSKDDCVVTYIEPNFKESTSCSLSFSLPTRFMSPLNEVTRTESSTIHVSKTPSLDVDISPGNVLPKTPGKSVLSKKNTDLRAEKTYQEKCIYKPSNRGAHHSQLSKEVKELFLVSRTLISSTESNDSQCMDKIITKDKSVIFPAQHVILENPKNNISVRNEQNDTERKPTNFTQSMQSSSQINGMTDTRKKDISHGNLGNSLSCWHIDPNAKGFPANAKETMTYLGVNNENNKQITNKSSYILDGLSENEKRHIQTASLFQTLGRTLYSRQDKDLMCYDALNASAETGFPDEIRNNTSESATNECMKTAKTNSRITQHVKSFVKPMQLNQKFYLQGNHNSEKELADKISVTGKVGRDIQRTVSRMNIKDIHDNSDPATSFPNGHKIKKSQEAETSSDNCLDLDPLAKRAQIDKRYSNKQEYFDHYGSSGGKPEGVYNATRTDLDDSDSVTSTRAKSVFETFMDSFRIAFTCFRPCAFLNHLNPWRNKASKTTLLEPCEGEKDEANVERQYRMRVEGMKVSHAPESYRCTQHCLKPSQLTAGQSQQSIKHYRRPLKQYQQSLKHSRSLIYSQNKLKPQMDRNTQCMSPFSPRPLQMMNTLADNSSPGVCKKYFGRSVDLQETYIKDGDIRHAYHTVFHASIQNYNKSKSCESINKKTDELRQTIFSSGAVYPYEELDSKRQYSKSRVSTQVCGDGDNVQKTVKGSSKSRIHRCKNKFKKMPHAVLQISENCSGIQEQQNDETEFDVNRAMELDAYIWNSSRCSSCAKKIVFGGKNVRKCN